MPRKKPAPPLEIVYRNPADLKPDPRNARTHSDDQLRQIRASIDEFGFTNPVLLRSDDTLGAGHGRREAALLDPPLPVIPTITLPGLTENQWRAYALADNKIAMNAGWDLDLLRAEIGDLQGLGFDLNLTGFDAGDLINLFLPSAEGPTDLRAAWQGMPEFDQTDKTAFRTIPVHFRDQAGVDAFAKLIKQLITDKTRFIWFPDIEIETYADKRYVAET